MHSSRGATIYEQGSGWGSFGCTVSIRLTVSGTLVIASYLAHPRDGSIRGTARARIHSATTRAAAFSGTIWLQGGTGAYAHASGAASFQGTINRKSYAMSIRISGRVRLAGARISERQRAARAHGAVTQGTEGASLHVSLHPARPGVSTTMEFGFQIGLAGGGLPPALTDLQVGLPPGMRVDTAGLAHCTRVALVHGPRGCPTDALVGSGSVLVKVPLGEVVRDERATLMVFNGPRRDGRATLLFYAAGRVPIATQIIFAGLVAPGPGGLTIHARIPLIPTLPDSPDAALVGLASTLGTLQHSYYRVAGGRRVRFTPRGVIVPGRCPIRGLAFSASFGFADATRASAGATVACQS